MTRTPEKIVMFSPDRERCEGPARQPAQRRLLHDVGYIKSPHFTGYPVLRTVKVCTDDPAPVPPAPCANSVDSTERIPLGYVGSYMDEIKVTKPMTGF